MDANKTRRNYWNKCRVKDNAIINTLTNSQHRAVSMLALYGYKICIEYEKMSSTHLRKSYANFLNKALPTMLHVAGLPELNFEEDLWKSSDTKAVFDKINKYLRYIDRKYGTWYELEDLAYVA